jgi:hypothetical protein
LSLEKPTATQSPRAGQDTPYSRAVLLGGFGTAWTRHAVPALAGNALPSTAQKITPVTTVACRFIRLLARADACYVTWDAWPARQVDNHDGWPLTGTEAPEPAEQRIRARGLHRAELGVEENNPRARALYERLGYVAYGSAPESWDAPDGSVVRYEIVCTLMRKELG